MTKLNRLTLAAVVALASATSVASYGATYNFSYTLTEYGAVPLTVTGSLEGTAQSGGTVDVDSVLSLTVGRYVAATPIRVSAYKSAVAVIAFDPNQNNFDFTSGNTEFFMIPYYGTPLAVGQTSFFYGEDFGAYFPANYTLTPVAAPEGTSTIALLGMGVTGLALLRRRL